MMYAASSTGTRILICLQEQCGSIQVVVPESATPHTNTICLSPEGCARKEIRCKNGRQLLSQSAEPATDQFLNLRPADPEGCCLYRSGAPRVPDDNAALSTPPPPLFSPRAISKALHPIQHACLVNDVDTPSAGRQQDASQGSLLTSTQHV